jgi:trehalose 6-phosphate phosphatase
MKFLNADHPVARPDGLRAWFGFVTAAPLRVLMLDFDGTLAPFTVDRLKTALYPGVGERLVRLAGRPRQRLIIVSGRTIADLRLLLPMNPHPECWGSHGWEHLAAGSDTPELHPMEDRHREGLDRAQKAASEEGWSDRIETKPASVALHWRGLSAVDREALERAAERRWGPIAAAADIGLHHFDGGLELRVPGRDKASVVETVLADIPQDAAVAYLGDDLTDEDAFRALDRQGFARPCPRGAEAHARRPVAPAPRRADRFSRSLDRRD